MKKVIATLIAVLNKTVFALSLNFSIPQDFYEVDPCSIQQPATRIFLVKKKSEHGCCITLHHEKLNDSLEAYFSRTKDFIEAKFPLEWKGLGSFISQKKEPIHLFELSSKRANINLKIIHAYFFKEKHLYLLAYSAPKELFSLHLDDFKSLINETTIDELPSVFNLLSLDERSKALKSFYRLIEEKNLSFEKFLKSKEVISTYESFFQKKGLEGSLFSLRAFFYE